MNFDSIKPKSDLNPTDYTCQIFENKPIINNHPFILRANRITRQTEMASTSRNTVKEHVTKWNPLGLTYEAFLPKSDSDLYVPVLKQ